MRIAKSLKVLAVAGFGVIYGVGAAGCQSFPHREMPASKASIFDERTLPKTASPAALPPVTADSTLDCERAKTPIAKDYGNHHDASILEGNATSKYDWYLFVSGKKRELGKGQLYGSNAPSHQDESWHLIDAKYRVARHHGVDDSIKIGKNYFAFLEGKIFWTDLNLEDASEKWKVVGSFPSGIDDVGAYFMEGHLHLFGEYGRFLDKPDGISIAHYKATYNETKNVFENWELVSTEQLNPNTRPNPDGVVWGVGDASLAEIDSKFYMLIDMETMSLPYRVGLWVSEKIDSGYEFAGIVMEPEAGGDGWLNFRVQDAEFLIRDESIFVFANWLNVDGNIDGNPRAKSLRGKKSRTVGGYQCFVKPVSNAVQ